MDCSASPTFLPIHGNIQYLNRLFPFPLFLKNALIVTKFKSVDFLLKHDVTEIVFCDLFLKHTVKVSDMEIFADK